MLTHKPHTSHVLKFLRSHVLTLSIRFLGRVQHDPAKTNCHMHTPLTFLHSYAPTLSLCYHFQEFILFASGYINFFIIDHHDLSTIFPNILFDIV